MSTFASSAIIFICVCAFALRSQQTATTNVNWNITDSFKFLLLGDTGKASEHRKTTVENLKKILIGVTSDIAGILLGDNFYEYGIDNTNSKKLFKRDFKDAFPQKDFDFKFYAVLGNHDYMGDIQSQINLTHNHIDTRWEMENNYYVKVLTGSNFNVTMIYIDTEEMLLGPFWAFYGIPAYVHYHWLEKVFEQHKYSSYIFVIGHHQVVSAGPHPPCPLLKNMLIPLFKKYKVNAYVVGHNHNSAYFRKKSGTGYVTTGAASRRSSLSRKKIKPKSGYLYNYDKGSSFATLEIGPTNAYLRYYEEEGNIAYIDSYDQRKYVEGEEIPDDEEDEPEEEEEEEEVTTQASTSSSS